MTPFVVSRLRHLAEHTPQIDKKNTLAERGIGITLDDTIENPKPGMSSSFLNHKEVKNDRRPS